MSRLGGILRSGGRFLAAWWVFFILWMLFMLPYTDGTIAIAARISMVATGIGAIGSVGVWWRTGRQPWPSPMTWHFVAGHVAGAVVFSLYWTILNPVLDALWLGMSILDIEWRNPLTAWRLLSGVWLYGIMAGLSYAIRIRQRLVEEEQRALLAEKSALASRLEVLRTGLQPHFLFNALHGVGSLIRSDAEAAEDAVEQLGELLRYAIRSRTSEYVRLAEEWTFAMDYLELQKIRFDDRLEVDARIGGDVEDVLVPVFSLQPLVENAVLHGVESGAGRGRVTLSAQRELGSLVLRVTDSGPGPGAKKGGNAIGHGTGLDTLRERLSSLYDDRASVSLRAMDAGGTEVVMHLPLEVDSE